MPFIPPLIGAALIGTGGAIGSTLLGSKLSQASPTSAEQNVLNLNANAMRTGQATAGTIFPQAQNLLTMGSAGYQPVLNYWSSILSGNRPAMTAALSPEISRISQGYQGAAQTSAALNPRSGPSVSFLSELPFAQQRDISSLLQTARPAAASNLFTTASGATGAGAGLFNTGVNALYGSTVPGRDILAQQAQLRQVEQQRGTSIGAGIFDLFTKYGMPAIQSIFNRPKVPTASEPNIDTGVG